MNIVEKTMSIIAPHTCIGCGVEGFVLCESCSAKELPNVPSRCYRCNAATESFLVCQQCKNKTALRCLQIVTIYDGLAKELVKRMKFGGIKAAAYDVGKILAKKYKVGELPIVVPMPTISSHSRERGFDHAFLVAQTYSRAKGYQMLPVLRRRGQVHQIGATRAERKRQLKNVFWVHHPERVKGKSVLLVDDVLTTGASIEEAARTLRRAGANKVDGLVFAHKL
jgi:ComF family protein